MFYTFCLFTSVNQLVYIFAVPMILGRVEQRMKQLTDLIEG